jgi:hypothetical protein
MNLNGLTFAITLFSGFPAQFKDETGRRFLLGIRFVAEVRHRAADDATLPTAGPLDRQARPGLEVIHFQWCRPENAWKLNEVTRLPGV